MWDSINRPCYTAAGMSYTMLKNNMHTLPEKQFCLVMVDVEGLVGRRWKWGRGKLPSFSRLCRSMFLLTVGLKYPQLAKSLPLNTHQDTGDIRHLVTGPQYFSLFS